MAITAKDIAKLIKQTLVLKFNYKKKYNNIGDKKYGTYKKIKHESNS